MTKSEEQRILVTGGAGFVGSWLVARLVEESKARIVILDNLCNGHRRFVPSNERVELVVEDITCAEAVNNVVAAVRPTWVFHLAALHFIPYCNAHPVETLQVNVVGTQNLLEACVIHEPEVLVAASSAAVYPIQDGPCSEDGPVGPTDIYGLSKYINEEQVRLYATKAKTRCVMARLSNVYGPNETNPHVIPEIVRQLLSDASSIALGNLEPMRDYVYATDVASALYRMAQAATKPFAVYNVGTGREYSVRRVVEVLAAAAGRAVEIGVSADRVRKSERMHLLCDVRRVRDELGWSPEYDIDCGLHALWAWATDGENAVATGARGSQ